VERLRATTSADLRRMARKSNMRLDEKTMQQVLAALRKPTLTEIKEQKEPTPAAAAVGTHLGVGQSKTERLSKEAENQRRALLKTQRVKQHQQEAAAKRARAAAKKAAAAEEQILRRKWNESPRPWL
jgi:hypothetical protein